ncbi:sulfurtransferase complex subunit TusB [Salmonella enterica]|nr:sulfurtransferase complex subunit TusB [Salmonella enterica]
MLHTLPHCASGVDFPALLRLLKEGDALLLLQDGVTVAIEGNRFLESLRDAPITVYALKEEIDARGLGGQISDSVVRVDYTEFVRLTVKYANQMAW